MLELIQGIRPVRSALGKRAKRAVRVVLESKREGNQAGQQSLAAPEDDRQRRTLSLLRDIHQILGRKVVPELIEDLLICRVRAFTWRC